ncbi:hypothetical protein [Leifsonia aquatica]|uniref:hypothetical protein n=1 Tax=Leifsonia aquatica TaxID=144185 RepID=UPI0028B09913|nr:hypothetical protein [Leifsonia aquatica]
MADLHNTLPTPTGSSTASRDPSPNGPFAASDDQNKRGEPLPYEAPVEGLFPDMRANLSDS